LPVKNETEKVLYRKHAGFHLSRAPFSRRRIKL